MSKKIFFILVLSFMLLGCTLPEQIEHDAENEPRMTCVIETKDAPEIESFEIDYYGVDDMTDKLAQRVIYNFTNEDNRDDFIKSADEFIAKYKNNPNIEFEYEEEGLKISQQLTVNIKDAEIQDLVDIQVLPNASSKSISMGLVKQQFEENGSTKCTIIGFEDK